MTRPTRLQRALACSLLLLTLAACRGNTADAIPTAAPTAQAQSIAPTPSPRPEATPTATFVAPFPAPGEDTSRAEGDPTLPTRTPTPPADSASAQPTRAPVCNGPTPATAEGANYLPNTPERAVVREVGMAGQPLLLSGYILDANCAPVAGAWLDFWQADADGVYDITSFRLRGHQFSDADGRFRLETIVPGAAGGRPPHIYVKVQAPGGEVLTTRLFFPDQPLNDSDDEFRPELLLATTPGADALVAHFDFVLP